MQLIAFICNSKNWSQILKKNKFKHTQTGQPSSHMMLVKQAANPHNNLHVLMTGDTATLVEPLRLVLLRTGCTIEIKLSWRINLYNLRMFFFV